MSSHGTRNDARELDVRNLDGEPFGDIMGALEDLPESETLVLVNDFEPEPLYNVLEQRGFEYRARQVDPDEWRIAIEHA